MVLMSAVEAQTPFENVRLPFFSWTVHVGPVAFTRRVKPASPGGRSSHPAGTGITFPSSQRTVLSLGPGATTRVSMDMNGCVCLIALVKQVSPMPEKMLTHVSISSLTHLDSRRSTSKTIPTVLLGSVEIRSLPLQILFQRVANQFNGWHNPGPKMKIHGQLPSHYLYLIDTTDAFLLQPRP